MIKHIAWTFVALFVAIAALIVTQRPLAVDTAAVFVGCHDTAAVFAPAETVCGLAVGGHGVFASIGAAS